MVKTPDERVETWTTGQAADYLEDLGVSRRKVGRLVAQHKLRALPRGDGEWTRVLADDVRAYRKELLAQLRAGHRDHAASSNT